MSPRVLTLAAFVFAAAPRAPQHQSMLHFFFSLGLVGLLLVAAVDVSFIPLPIPGITDILLIIYAAAHQNPILLVLIATTGSTIGALSSHTAGRAGGIAFLEKRISPGILQRVTVWIDRHAILSVSIPAILPPPMLLTPFLLVAGAVRMSRKKFLLSFSISRFLRHCIAVWLGIHYGRRVIRLFNHLTARWGNTFLIVLAAVLIPSLALGIYRLYKSTRDLATTDSTAPTDTLPEPLPTTPIITTEA